MQWWNLRRQPRRSRPGRRSNSSRWIHSRMPSNSEHAAYRYRAGTTPLFVAFAKAMVIAPRGAAVGQAEVATPQNPSRDGLSTTLSRSPLLGSLPLAIAEIPAERRQYRSWLRFRDSYRQTPYGRAKRVSSSIVGNSKVMAVRDHRCEITGVKFRAGLLNH